MKDTEFDFKKFRWGDPEEDVIREEGEPEYKADIPATDTHYIAYNVTAAGKDAVLAYYFCDEGLYRTRYILSENHSNETLYIDDYEDVKKAITKKYGEPLFDEEMWQDDSKKDYYASKKGDALNYGYLEYWTWYALDRTYINMSMSADNYEISTTIDYTSKQIDAGEPDYSDDF